MKIKKYRSRSFENGFSKPAKLLSDDLFKTKMLDGVEKDEFEQKRRFTGKDDAVD